MKLPAPIIALLKEHLAAFPGGADDLVFTTKRGAPIRHTLFYKRVFKPAVKTALPERLHRLRWHDLRHTAASLSLAVEPNLHTVKVRLGHEDIQTTVNIYGHLLPSTDAALADGLAAMFEGAGAGEADNVRELRR
jgi:integrase